MSEPQRPGILPCQSIEALIASGAIAAESAFEVDQVQPASLDLRLGGRAWRVRASFLPGRNTVRTRIAEVAMHELDLTKGAVLERGCVYIAELQERLALPRGISARANPKSSTGRVDVFVRLLSDGGHAFDDVDEGYAGPIFMEIAPQTFSVLVRTGTRLNQLRLKAGVPERLRIESVGVDLTGDIAGFRGRRHAGVVDLDHEDGHDPRDFWEPLLPRNGQLLLDPGEFYILASKQAVEIPVMEAAEMTPIDPSVGEFRVHYAGFFDPGFGTDEAHGKGSKGVLEVRSHETPFILEDGQTVARMVYEPLTEKPTRLYGDLGSHYQRQGLKLSKHFQGLDGLTQPSKEGRVSWWRRSSAVVAAALGAWFCSAAIAAAAPAMWVVKDADSQIYLFGTLHALSPTAKWRTPAYDQAYAKAGVVWFEADMEAGDPDTVRLIVQRYGSDPDKPLSRKLAAADVGALARQGVDVGRINHLRPWAAALMLSMQPAIGRGARVDTGADLTMTRASRASEKRIKTFETLEDQARMYASLPERSEVAYLSGVIRERAAPAKPRLRGQDTGSLEQSWLGGDLARLGPGLVGDMKAGNPALYDALLRSRNLAWAEKLTQAMQGSGVELVNVGALHMVGPDGLPALLAAKGFTVERVQ